MCELKKKIKNNYTVKEGEKRKKREKLQYKITSFLMTEHFMLW